MDKFLIKSKRPLTPSVGSSNFVNSTSNHPSGEASDKKARVEFFEDDIISDPALRKPIKDYAIDIRDEIRRRYLAQGPCQPYGHNFPQRQFGKIMRKFRDAWFMKYEWLEYSVPKDAAFCFWCYLFGGGKGAKYGCEVFTKMGFTNWKKAIEKFNDHVGGVNSPHNDARIQCVAFKDQRLNLPYMLCFESQEIEVTRRTQLTVIVDVIRFLLEQGLTFQENDESGKSLQRGNFFALLDWYIVHIADVNKVVNLNDLENNQLTSPLIQKQIVSVCAAETTEVILNDIGDNFFSLLIDEIQDGSVKERLVVVLRYVNKFGEVVERFLGAVYVSDTSAQFLKSAIDDFFAKNGLSLLRLRGQGYNGTSNMRGEFNGLKTLILNENPHARYMHCFAQQLHLVIVAVAGKNSYVSIFFYYVSAIVNVVGASCKRKDALRQKQHDQLLEQLERGETSTGKDKHQETNLARPRDTRWGSHYKTIIRLLSMWHSVLEVLENIYDDGVEPKIRGTVVDLFDNIEKYEFVFIAHLMRDMLGITNELSQLLQQKDQNIGTIVRMIQIVKERLQEAKENGWDELLEEVNQFCTKNNICVPNMEDNVSSRIRSRCGGQSVTYFHHFRVEIFCQVIDLIAQEMENRFTESSIELLMCIACLDPRNSFANFDHSTVLRLAELYSEDFSIFDQMELKQQLKNYIHSVRTNDDFSDLHDIGALAKKMVETGYYTIFPLVYLLMELALVLPVATATVERAFSTMNIIKSDLYSKMADDFLIDGLVCYIEKEIFRSIQNEVILQRFQNMQTQIIQLPPLSRSHSASGSAVN